MMKKTGIFLIMILAISNLNIEDVYSFNDVKEHWARNNITELTNSNIINGFEDNTFRPNNNITIAQFIKMVIKIKGENIKQGKEYWAQPFIDKATDLSIIDEGEFEEFDRNINRVEMARIIAKASESDYTPKNVNFVDISNLDYDNKKHIEEVLSKGIIQGYNDNTFKPEANATRAEAATMLVRFKKHLKASEKIEKETEEEQELKNIETNLELNYEIMNLEYNIENNDLIFNYEIERLSNKPIYVMVILQDANNGEYLKTIDFEIKDNKDSIKIKDLESRSYNITVAFDLEGLYKERSFTDIEL